MSARARFILIAAVTGCVGRVLIGLMVMAMDRFTHESDMLLLFDVPTLGVYLLLAQLGYVYDVHDAYDMRFLAVSSLTWIVVGGVVGWIVWRLRNRGSISSPSDVG